MLFLKKILIIMTIAMLVLSSCCNDEKVMDEKFNIFLDLSVDNIKSITLSTQMIEKPPGKVTIDNKSEIELIVKVFKDVEYQLFEESEDENGWLFSIIIENENIENINILVQRSNIRINGKHYKISNNISEKLLEIYNNIK